METWESPGAAETALRETKARHREALGFYRAEVHLREGGQDYDVMNWTREQVIADVLDQYEKHLHFLDLMR